MKNSTGEMRGIEGEREGKRERAKQRERGRQSGEERVAKRNSREFPIEVS